MMRTFYTSTVLLLLVFFGKSIQGQSVNFFYELKPGTGTKDSVILYGLSNSLNSVSIQAVNFSFAFQSSCPFTYSVGICSGQSGVLELDDNVFTDIYSSFLERCEVKNGMNLSYDGVNYNHRFSYANISIANSWVAPPSNSGSRMLLTKLLVDKNCVSDVYMENATENPINQISDNTFSPIPYQIFRFGSAFPISFNTFSASKIAPQQVQLNWETLQEENSDYFEVQKSYVGDFTRPQVLGIVTAAGFSDELQTYNWQDNEVFQPEAYYRLRVVDIDGAVSYSPIISVYMGDSPFNFWASPNPASDILQLNIAGRQTQAYEMRLVDIHGRVIKTEQVVTDPEYPTLLQWDVSELASGIYHVHITEQVEPYRSQFEKVFVR